MVKGAGEGKTRQDCCMETNTKCYEFWYPENCALFSGKKSSCRQNDTLQNKEEEIKGKYTNKNTEL